MKKLARITVLSTVVMVLSAAQVRAATFTEVEDAGEQLDTAQAVLQALPSLDSVSGALSGDADVFQLSLTGGQTFSATTVGGADFDTQLFLFDAAGKGVYANDNAGSSAQSTLLVSRFTPAASGVYYLGISGFDYDPVSAGGEIFRDFPEVAFSEVAGPASPGGKAPLSGFDGARLDPGGNYTIGLTGAKPVPEPSSTLATLALGAWGAGSLLKKKRQA